MKISKELLGKIVSDLGLDKPFIKGQDISVRNVWHFSSDGTSLDLMFNGEEDLRLGMNRVFILCLEYNCIILAFALMDTHFHFILYGEYDDCNRFVHEYLRRTSQYLAASSGENNKLCHTAVSCQTVTTLSYLRTVICYTVKNPPTGGLPYLAHTYPWSSGALYFAGHSGSWTTAGWISMIEKCPKLSQLTLREQRVLLHNRSRIESDARVIDGIVFPGDYVAYELVERIFKSCRSFNYFMCRSKESDVDALGGTISHLSLPLQEMRQHKNEICMELFGHARTQMLDTRQRIQLARTLRARFNSSDRQIIRLYGLVYDEVKSLL